MHTHQDHEDDRTRPTTVTATLPKWLADVATAMLQLLTHPDNAEAGQDGVLVITGAITHTRAGCDKRVVKGWAMYETAAPRIDDEAAATTLQRLGRICKANGIAMGQITIQNGILMRKAAETFGSEIPGETTKDEIIDHLTNEYQDGLLRVIAGKTGIGAGSTYEEAVENAQRHPDAECPPDEE